MNIRDSVLIETTEDDVGLWSIHWHYRESGRETDKSNTRRETLELVKDLLEEELIQAGQFKDGDFELWNLSPTETIARIETEWDALQRDPTLGDIVWFIATEKGEQEAKKLSQNRGGLDG